MYFEKHRSRAENIKCSAFLHSSLYLSTHYLTDFNDKMSIFEDIYHSMGNLPRFCKLAFLSVWMEFRN